MTASTRVSMIILPALLAALGCGRSPAPSAPDAEASASAGDARTCAGYTSGRRAFYGDLHVHTAYSHDAWAFDTRTTPEQAYRFARGEPLLLAPLDEMGQGTRRIQLERPLDFAAVADHAEYFGPTLQCTDPTSPGYGSESCAIYREDGRARTGVPMGAGMGSLTEATYRRMAALSQEEVCGGDAASCFGVTDRAWRATIAAAERWNDTSRACRFSALVGYEYSMTPDLTKIHRNVIFRSAEVPESPISWAHARTPWKLWERLRTECVDAEGGCDVLTIPHNSNLSNGRLFEIEYGDARGLEAEVAAARLRQRMEPLTEMMQIKGDGECRNGMWGVVGSDELCAFEKFDFNIFRPGSPPPPDCEDGASEGALVGEGCISRRDFYRYALADGLREADRLGVNPFKVGAIASTDGHDGAPGDVEEYLYDGKHGRALNDFGFNPGGLAAVWAEQNTRASLFDAMKRRETFGTSGPRMSVRFFGGWDYPEDLCHAPDLVARGYAGGVPMGGDLPVSNPSAAGPSFVLAALADPGTTQHPGNALQRVQIIKGWAEGSVLHQEVYEVAGNPNNGADVDPSTCEPRGPGETSLCGVWRDPRFDPAQRAFYYARVVENPSCRYSTLYCRTQPEGERPEVCRDPSIEPVIRERAWTSPIWYTPPVSRDS